MPIPFPGERTVDVSPPKRAETLANAAGILSATRLESNDAVTGNTEFQRLLMTATFESMTGHSIEGETLPVVSAQEFAECLRHRAEPYRMRMVHMMVPSALVLRPLTADVAERVGEFSREIGIDFNVLAKSTKAIEQGSVSPWEPGGISEAQLASGKLLAERTGVEYDPRGATR